MDNKSRYKAEQSSERLVLSIEGAIHELPLQRSVLHSGIYTQELSSMFAAFMVSFIYIIYISFTGQIHWLNYIIAGVAFIILFPCIRIFIFKKHMITVIFDKADDLVTIIHNGIIKRKKTIKLSSLSEIFIDHKVIEPQNQDGIEFVKKISAQHGAPMPDLGSIEHFYNIFLIWSEGRIMIFSSPILNETEGLFKIIRGFCPHIKNSSGSMLPLNTCQKEQI